MYKILYKLKCFILMFMLETVILDNLIPNEKLSIKYLLIVKRINFAKN